MELRPGAGEPPMTRFLAEQLSTAHWFDQRETRAASAGHRGSGSTRASGACAPPIRATLQHGRRKDPRRRDP